MRNLVWLAVLVLAGCGSTEVRYEPQAKMSIADATKVVERLLWEQAPPFAPKEVVVTDESFRTPGQRDGEIGAYYKSIANIGVFSKKGYFITLLTDKNGETLFRSYHRDETSAKQFADAIASLRR